jgi:two-component system LytT family response regulator
MKTCIIIDDEEAARELLKEYLEDFDYLKLLGEASDGLAAVELINAKKPDIIFLDIQMPELNGFQVLQKIDELPTIIFSTAFDQYAIKAFEIHALDYLLKPYTKKRFEKAIERINSENNDKTADLIEAEMVKKELFPDRILLAKGSQFYNIRVDNIIKIEALGDYAKVFTKQAFYLYKHGIGEMEKRLNPQQFLRIHRSTIINKN